MTGDDGLKSLREALWLSPDNVPLRQHLAETLLGMGRPAEAEAEYRHALNLAPDEAGLKVGLATAFYQQGKHSHAIVIVEDLAKHANAPAKAYMLYARLLVGAGEVERAVRQYKKAVEVDPSVADLDLANRLGIQSAARSHDDEDAAYREVVDGRVRESWEGGGADVSVPIERPRDRFDSVGGMEQVKDEIRMKIIHPLTHPELYKAYGKKTGGGILLYGPPGCGKTHLARATAGEIKASFLAVGINDVLDMWIGTSEKNLHELFEQARANKPCVLFFDEVDALAASRADMRTSHGRHLINQFLAEMDGMQSDNEGVLILAATNAPWHVDPAFRRPGRFDRIIFVPPPDAPARAAILRIHTKGKPVDTIDYDHVAKKAEGFSGADLRAVVDAAVEAKLKEAMKAGVPRPLTTKDFTSAMSAIKPSTREWFSTARNYALYSNQGGIYDDILKFLKL
jgi:AAA+ superfamily predicted ATPase